MVASPNLAASRFTGNTSDSISSTNGRLASSSENMIAISSRVARSQAARGKKRWFHQKVDSPHHFSICIPKRARNPRKNKLFLRPILRPSRFPDTKEVGDSIRDRRSLNWPFVIPRAVGGLFQSGVLGEIGKLAVYTG